VGVSVTRIVQLLLAARLVAHVVDEPELPAFFGNASLFGTKGAGKQAKLTGSSEPENSDPPEGISPETALS
jgi:hypothetical protein